MSTTLPAEEHVALPVIDLATLPGLRVNSTGTIYLPEREAWIYLGALMEIGAVVHSGKTNDYTDLAAPTFVMASLPFSGLCDALSELHALRFTTEHPYALFIDPADPDSKRVGITDKVRRAMERRLHHLFRPEGVPAHGYWWTQQVLDEDFQEHGRRGSAERAAMWRVVETKAAENRAFACYLLAEIC